MARSESNKLYFKLCGQPIKHMDLWNKEHEFTDNHNKTKDIWNGYGGGGRGIIKNGFDQKKMVNTANQEWNEACTQMFNHMKLMKLKHLPQNLNIIKQTISQAIVPSRKSAFSDRNGSDAIFFFLFFNVCLWNSAFRFVVFAFLVFSQGQKKTISLFDCTIIK